MRNAALRAAWSRTRSQRLARKSAPISIAGSREAVLGGERVHAFEDGGKAAARDGAVDRVVIGKDRRERGERALARFPQFLALERIGRDAHLGRAAALEDRAHGGKGLEGLLGAA